MTHDELAFANHQLAGMLKGGIPLEGALRQLCAEMQRGSLRTELQALEADLVRGTPLGDALGARRLPDFYKAMLQVGARSNDMPGVLTLLADYYHRAHLSWTRLKGVLVYPFIVLATALGVSVVVAVIYQRLTLEVATDITQGLLRGQSGIPNTSSLLLSLWAPVGAIAVLCTVGALLVAVPSWRRELRWRFPGFKEAGLSHLASALALMLEKGCTLEQALALLQQVEAGSPIAQELAQWKTRLAAGHKSFAELAGGGRLVPPLFVWLVAGSGEDWVGGFRQAAKVYFDRARHRVEVLLYAALPVSVLALGLMIVTQVLPMARMFAVMMRAVSNTGDAFE
jgi:type II secretory pathway component PulF